jgi:hypothetical protein
MADDGRTESESHGTLGDEIRSSGFVRRLIPTAAAAGLIFTGCLPSSTNNGGGDGGTTTSDAADTDTSGSDTNWTIDDASSNGLVDGNGRLTDDEFRGFCTLEQDCDPESFSTRYETIGECARELSAEHQESLDGYAQENGQACADAIDAAAECKLSTAYCDSDDVYYTYDQGCFDDVLGMNSPCGY